jgi:two-component system chemotaxis sensor kinase CheA
MSEGYTDDLIEEYIAESYEHLATIEADLLAMEAAGAAVSDALANRVFRAAHSIKGGAGMFDLVQIRRLAHQAENTLELIRSRRLVPTPEVVTILLKAFDALNYLIRNRSESNSADIDGVLSALAALTPDDCSAKLDNHEPRRTLSMDEKTKNVPHGPAPRRSRAKFRAGMRT